jgi:hypothetical protein
MEINIFLASSEELKEDRNSFQIFLSQLNESWKDQDIQFKLTLWEDFKDAMSRSGLQGEYNIAAGQCDIFVMLFFTKVGRYTGQEFEAALSQFQTTGKPLIYTYFKEDYIFTGQINEDIISMLEFKKKLKALNHYFTTYTSFEDLKWQFSRQLEKTYGDIFSSDFDIGRIKDIGKIDSLLIEGVCKILSPQSIDISIQHIQLKELINKASEFGKTVVFQLAKVNRRANRNHDRNLMARSIPLLEALAENDIRKDHHYYFGQLGYALKDQTKADWEKAHDSFTTAIEIRDNTCPEYFYEFNRAICKVSLDANIEKMKPSDTNIQDLIVSDLAYAKKGIGNQFENLITQEKDNRNLKKWLQINKINYQDL